MVTMACNHTRVTRSACEISYTPWRYAWRHTSSVIPSMTSMGSSTLPRDLDILRPCASRTMECRNTVLKGTLPADYHIEGHLTCTICMRCFCIGLAGCHLWALVEKE